MPLSHILVLALVQGITEFLPISSSAHLILVPVFMEWQDQGLVIDLALHFGTLSAVLIYYRHELAAMLRAAPAIFKPQARAGGAADGRRLVLALIVGTLPIILVGGALVIMGRDELLRGAEIIGWTSIIFGIVLYWADRYAPQRLRLADVGPRRALVIGLTQILAIIPGVSRAGITMTAGRFLGLDRTNAARFSMLLAIPTILASAAGGVLKLMDAGSLDLTLSAGIAAVLAALVAYVTILLFMRWIGRASMTPFVIYRVILGAVILGWVYF